MKMLEDYDEKNLQNEKEVLDYVNFRNENDKWITAAINSCVVLGVNLKEKTESEIDNADTSLSICIKEDTEVPESLFAFDTSLTSEGDIVEAVSDTGLFLLIPNAVGEKDYIVPIRYTAVESVFNRAGISGFTIHNETTKPNAAILTKEQKASIITNFFSLYGADTKILIRDGKVSFMASSQYSVLNEKQLFEIIKDVVNLEYPMHEFVGGTISQESFGLHYLFNDDDMELELQNKLTAEQFPVTSVKSGFTFHTSDVGESSVSVFPYFLINESKKLCCGNPISVKHIGKNNVKDFEKAIKKMNSLFKTSSESFAKLAEIKIDHAGYCLANICMFLKLPKKITLSVAKTLQETHELGCTGFEIYWAMCEIADIYSKQEKLYSNRSLVYQETVAKAINFDFKKFDNKYGIFEED